MEIEKYSPKWLLEKINDSKIDAHKLMHIIEYRKELIESYKKQLTLTDVSQQRELLVWLKNKDLVTFTKDEIEEVIDDYKLNQTNCG